MKNPFTGRRAALPPLPGQAADPMPEIDRGPPDQSSADIEMRRIAAEARERLSNQRAWRQWAIEKLLASPGAAGLLAAGWIVQSGEAEHTVEPGRLITINGPVSPPERIPAPLFAIADDLIDYVTTGNHPGAAPGEAAEDPAGKPS